MSNFFYSVIQSTVPTGNTSLNNFHIWASKPETTVTLLENANSKHRYSHTHLSARETSYSDVLSLLFHYPILSSVAPQPVNLNQLLS